jgi:hypothetical protein
MQLKVDPKYLWVLAIVEGPENLLMKQEGKVK